MKRWTPLHIELMIHYHCSPEVFPRADAPAAISYTADLVADGLVDRVNAARYRSTDRGKAFLELLCRTPLPELIWADPVTRKEIVR